MSPPRATVSVEVLCVDVLVISSPVSALLTEIEPSELVVGDELAGVTVTVTGRVLT